MKRFVLVLALVLAFAAVAGAEDFGKFTATVPAGWTSAQNGPTTIFTKGDNTAQVSITIAETGGATTEQLAKAFADEFAKNGFTGITTPAKDNDGDYSFDMKNPQGVDSHVMISENEGNYLLIVMTGAENAKDEVLALLGSLEDK